MARRTSPTVSKRILARGMRERRELAGVSLARAAQEVGVDKSTIARWESATAAIQPANVAPLLRLYGVEECDIPPLTELARRARKRGWWASFTEAFPEWFATYVGLETEAASVEEYQPLLIPGLFQTQDYAHAVIRSEFPNLSDDQVKRRVELRMERQRRDDGPGLWAIIGEGALRTPVGGRGVMRAQLQHLWQAASRPHHTVQVLPFSAGEHAGMGGGFILLRFADAAGWPVAYLETRAGSLYVEEPEEVAQYTDLYRTLTASALGARGSADMIKAAVDQI